MSETRFPCSVWTDPDGARWLEGPSSLVRIELIRLLTVRSEWERTEGVERRRYAVVAVVLGPEQGPVLNVTVSPARDKPEEAEADHRQVARLIAGAPSVPTPGEDAADEVTGEEEPWKPDRPDIEHLLSVTVSRLIEQAQQGGLPPLVKSWVKNTLEKVVPAFHDLLDSAESDSDATIDEDDDE